MIVGMTTTGAVHEEHRWRKVAGIVLALAVVFAAFAFVLPRIADYHAVWRVLERLSWQQGAALCAVTCVNLATDPLPWAAAVPGLGVRRAFVVTQASTAATYIAPAGDVVGPAVTFGILRGWGFTSASVSLAVVLTGIWNVLAQLAFPAVALALLSLEKERYGLLTTVALVGLGTFVACAGALALALRNRDVARRLGDAAARLADRARHLLRRDPVTWSGETVVEIRDEAVGLLRQRWSRLTLATIAGQLSVFAILLVSLRVVDVPASAVSIVEAFAAWSLVRLLSAMPITPGGVGIVEVGLTSALVAFGGPNDRVVAAVLVYRVMSVLPTLALGLVAAGISRRTR
jgi:putative heme transporter